MQNQEEEEDDERGLEPEPVNSSRQTRPPRYRSAGGVEGQYNRDRGWDREREQDVERDRDRDRDRNRERERYREAERERVSDEKDHQVHVKSTAATSGRGASRFRSASPSLRTVILSPYSFSFLLKCACCLRVRTCMACAPLEI